MKEVKATIVYPVEVTIQVPNEATTDQIWQDIIEAADEEVIGTAPVIHTCSDPNVINSETVQFMPLDSQEDFVGLALQSLKCARAALAPAVSIRSLLKPEVRPDVLLELDRILEQEINLLIASVSEYRSVDLES